MVSIGVIKIKIPLLYFFFHSDQRLVKKKKIQDETNGNWLIISNVYAKHNKHLHIYSMMQQEGKFISCYLRTAFFFMGRITHSHVGVSERWQ